jgi:hypothetical protein
MTTSRDVDEIASALIDGALGPDEADAARRDPAVAARAAEMQSAREAVRRVPPPDPIRRDDAIAAALTAGLAAYDPPRAVPGYDVAGDPGASGGLDAPVGGRRDESAAPTTPPPVGGPPGPVGVPPGAGRVVPMGPTGPARRRKWTDPRWLGAAAAVLLVLALGGVLATSGTSSDDDSGETATAMEDSASSTTGDESAGESGGGSAEGGADSSAASPEQSDPGAAPDRSSGVPSSPGVVDLGDVESADELAERAGQALTATRADAEESAEDEAPPADGNESQGSGPLTASEVCPDPLASTPDAGPVVLQGRATLGGDPVDVWVHDNGSTRRMVAVAVDGSCAVVANRPIPG